MDTVKKAFKHPVAIYTFIIGIILISDWLLDIILDIISDFVCYEIINTFPKYARIIYLRLMFSMPVIIAVFCIGYICKKRSFADKILKILTHFIGICIISVMGFTLIDKGLYIRHRYNYAVLQANDRFEPVELTDRDFSYFQNGRVSYSFAKEFDDLTDSWAEDTAIVYIYDKDNLDTYTENYIKKLIDTQPLRLYKLEKRYAREVMLHNKIGRAPAIIMIVDNNNDVMKGYSEISMLETKIHNYKQHNIYFY